MKDKIEVYRVGEMWDQTDENEDFYIKRNSDVVGEKHLHDCFEIELIVKGTCKEIVNGIEKPVADGDITLITPVDLHEVSNIQSLELYNVMFNPEIIDEKILDLILTNNDNRIISIHLENEDFNYALNILNRAEKEYRQKQKNYDRFVVDAINQLLIMIIRQYEHSDIDNNELTIRAATLFIRMNFKNNPSLTDVAKSVGLDAAYFSVRFHEMMGVTYKEYINSIKLNYASRALRMRSDTPVSDICYNSGFESLSNFHRQFKKKFGCSPREYAKINRDN